MVELSIREDNKRAEFMFRNLVRKIGCTIADIMHKGNINSHPVYQVQKGELHFHT